MVDKLNGNVYFEQIKSLGKEKIDGDKSNENSIFELVDYEKISEQISIIEDLSYEELHEYFQTKQLKLQDAIPILTEEQADIYAKGEEEIKRRLTSLVGMVDLDQAEKDIREAYRNEHPEYAAVEERGKAMEEAHDKEIREKMQEWEKQHPAPKSDPLRVGGFAQDAKYMKERAEYQEQLESEYCKNHPEYNVIKESKEEAKHKLF